MRTIWHSLAWKEWNEHKWKLAAISAIVIGVVTTMVRGFDQQATEVIPLIAIFCLVPLTVFVAATDATGEKSSRTRQFLHALPVSNERAAVSKVVFGLIACVTPLLLVVGLMLCFNWLFVLTGLSKPFEFRLPGPYPDNGIISAAWWSFAFLSIGISTIVSFYLWTVSVAVLRKDEVSGGAAALAVIAGVWTITVLAFNYLAPSNLQAIDNHPAAYLTFSALPGGLAIFLANTLFQEGSSPNWIAPLLTFLAVHMGLAIWYVRRFARGDSNENKSPRGITTAPNNTFWLAPPRRSRVSAILWKLSREMAPVLLVGLIAVVCAIVAIAFVNPEFVRDARIFAALATTVVVYVGFLVTLVIGIGLFLNDLEPKLNTFWRSRPISPDLAYWLKFCTGLVVLSGALLLPILLAGQAKHPDLLLGTAYFVYVFAAAVGMTCLLRNAVYAAVLSIGLLSLGMASVVLIRWALTWLGVIEFRDSYNIYEPSQNEIGVAVLVMTIVMTLVGWLAVRNDWGWKAGRG